MSLFGIKPLVKKLIINELKQLQSVRHYLGEDGYVACYHAVVMEQILILQGKEKWLGLPRNNWPTLTRNFWPGLRRNFWQGLPRNNWLGFMRNFRHSLPRNQKRGFVKLLMRHWHSLPRKIWLEDAKEMAQFPRSIHQ
jgi:hypothetical protein